MKKSLWMKLVLITIMATLLAGCVIRPWDEDDERSYHQGEYWHEHHDHGDHHRDYNDFHDSDDRN